MNSICIFCGSSLGSNPIFQQIAQLTGEAIAKQGKTLVYGGGRSGLMGVVADSALQAGGQVIGVIPRALVDRELAHPGLTNYMSSKICMSVKPKWQICRTVLLLYQWGRYIGRNL
ncbi:LOG family protein [Acinetobacter baumannii]